MPASLLIAAVVLWFAAGLGLHLIATVKGLK